MLALQLVAHGLDGLRMADVARPATSSDVALVQVKAAGINPSDLANVEGKFKQTTLPRIVGRDYAGVVVDGPAEWRGAAVWGSGAELGFTVDGTHGEFVAVPIASLARKPRSIDFTQAAAAGVPLATAWQAIVSAGRVQRGETVLVTGAAGAVGSMACQIAQHFGARVIGIVRGSQRVPNGVTSISSEQPELANAIRDATDGKGVDLALDAVSGELFEPVFQALAQGGRLAIIIAKGGGTIPFNLRDFYRRALSLHGVNSLIIDSVATAEIYRAAGGLIDAGRLRIEQPTQVPLDQAIDAYRRLARGESGKFVLIHS